MSDLSLLLFGCVVSFIAAAGAYVYARECFAGAERTRKVPVRAVSERDRRRPDRTRSERLRDVA